MTWRAHPQQVGDDVAPTSLNDGRGEVVVLALVVVFHLGLKRRLVGGWMGRGGGTSKRVSGVPNVEMCQMRKGRIRAILGMGANRGFPWRSSAESHKPGHAESKPYRQVGVGAVSNVIYQRCM